MSPLLVLSCYGSAALLALLALWYFGVKHWWWHAGSIALALGVGIVRFPATFNQPFWTLAIGWVFVFFFLWGAGAPVVVALRHPQHFSFRHHH